MNRITCVMLLFAMAALPGISLETDEFLSELRTVLESIDSYQVRISQWSIHEGELDAKIMNFYYSRPDLVRVDVIEGNRGVGSTGVLHGDDRVTVRSGSRLLPIRLSFDLDHRFVTTNRGRTFLDGSLSGVYDRLIEDAGHCDVTVEALEESIVVTVQPCDNQIRQSVEFSADTLLPVRSVTFEGGTRVEEVTWSSYLLTQPLPAELFDISTSQNQVERAGIELALTPVRPAERNSARLE